MNYLESIKKALRKALLDKSEVVLMGEDICDPYGGAFKVTKGLSTEFPGRLINTPISESALAGVAAGMALRGLHPILEIMFGDFLSLCVDQIVNHASKFHWMYNEQVSVPMVIRTPMGGYRGYGPTHSQVAEKLFFGFPFIKILSPSRFHDPGEVLESAVDENGVVLYIENKLAYSEEIVEPLKGFYRDFRVRTENHQGYPCTVLSSCETNEKPAVTLITYGGASDLVFESARQVLLDEEITCEIIIPSCIKPLSRELIALIGYSISQSGKVLVIEEGHLSWGWGSELAAKISEFSHKDLKTPVRRVGALDLPIPCAKPLEALILPGIEGIVSAIRQLEALLT